MKVDVPKPAYDSHSYDEFEKQQKAAGLMRKFWHDLPKMWKRELRFRKQLESSLNKFVNDKPEIIHCRYINEGATLIMENQKQRFAIEVTEENNQICAALALHYSEPI